MIYPREKPEFLNLLCKTCHLKRSLPRSMIITCLQNVSTLPEYGGGSADVYQGKCNGHPVAIKVMRFCTTVDAGLLLSVGTPFHAHHRKISLPRRFQRFCREAVAWRHLRHPNVLPLLGAALDATGPFRFGSVSEWMGNGRATLDAMGPFGVALVSEWMSSGNINEFIRKHVDTNRAQLVSYHHHCPPAQKPTWPITKAGGCRSRVGVSSQLQLRPRGLEGS